MEYSGGENTWLGEVKKGAEKRPSVVLGAEKKRTLAADNGEVGRGIGMRTWRRFARDCVCSFHSPAASQTALYYVSLLSAFLHPEEEIERRWMKKRQTETKRRTERHRK